MEESKDLKPGDTWSIAVGGQILKIEPIPYGQLKKIMKIVFSALDKIQNMESKDVMRSLPMLFEQNLSELIALMFRPKKHVFLTKTWVDENVTLVDMEKIIEAAIVINGLKDFLDKMGMGKKQPTPTVNEQTEQNQTTTAKS